VVSVNILPDIAELSDMIISAGILDAKLSDHVFGGIAYSFLSRIKI